MKSLLTLGRHQRDIPRAGHSPGSSSPLVFLKTVFSFPVRRALVHTVHKLSRCRKVLGQRYDASFALAMAQALEHSCTVIVPPVRTISAIRPSSSHDPAGDRSSSFKIPHRVPPQSQKRLIL
jgi:hypothetical protein